MVAFVSASADPPKVIAKTTFESKWVTGSDGNLVEQKIPKKSLWKVIMKKTSMPDPTNPAQSIVVEVPTEVPYQPNRKATKKLDHLKKRLSYLRKREKQLRNEYHQAAATTVDNPVVEDGAPAPPDPQEIAMAAEIVGEIEAVHMPKAKNIRQTDLDAARLMARDAGAGRQATWDWFTDMAKKKLVPDHAWQQYM